MTNELSSGRTIREHRTEGGNYCAGEPARSRFCATLFLVNEGENQSPGCVCVCVSAQRAESRKTNAFW